MSFLADDAMDKLVIELVRANISIAGKSQFEILLQKQIVSGRAFILYIILKVSFGLEWSKMEILHKRHYFIINRNPLKTYINPVTVYLIKSCKPRMLPNLR